MKKSQLTLIVGVMIGMVMGPGLASASTIFSDDFSDLSQWNAPHGGGVAGVDTETGSRTVFGRDGTGSTVPAAEIQVDLGTAIQLNDPTLKSMTLDTVMRVNTAAGNLIIEFRNNGVGEGEFHRLYTSVNGHSKFEFREYVASDTFVQGNDDALATPLGNTQTDADYFTVRVNYDFPTSTWSLSSDHTGTMTENRSFVGATGGEVDRLRLRAAAPGGNNSSPLGSSWYFVDSMNLYTTAIPEPGTLGLLGVAGLVIAGLRRRRG